MQIESYDLVQRCVPDHGWLPIIQVNHREVFRGSFQPTAEQALTEAQKYVNQALDEFQAQSGK
jgi:hypothetical protein